MDADPWNNIILTQTERLTMSSRPANPKNARNKNVLVIGGSGSGKTRFFIKPNIMQCTKTKGCSLVITDPKGQNLLSCSCAGRLQTAATGFVSNGRGETYEPNQAGKRHYSVI